MQCCEAPTVDSRSEEGRPRTLPNINGDLSLVLNFNRDRGHGGREICSVVILALCSQFTGKSDPLNTWPSNHTSSKLIIPGIVNIHHLTLSHDTQLVAQSPPHVRKRDRTRHLASNLALLPLGTWRYFQGAFLSSYLNV